MRKYQKEMEDFEMLKISLICYKNREEKMKKYLQDHPIEEPEFREN